MLKRVVIVILMLPGLLMVMVTSVAKRMTDGMDLEAIKSVSETTLKFTGLKGMNLFSEDEETNLLLIMYNINSYSYVIITVGAIWIAILLYILIVTWRSKDDKKN